MNLGYVLSLADRDAHTEGRQHLLDAIASCQAVGNQRLEGWAHAHLTSIEHGAHAHERELIHAAKAVERLGTSPGLRAWALATRARALGAVGRHAEALEDSTAAVEVLQRLGGILQGESLPPLVHARTLAELQNPAAASAAQAAVERLDARAQRLGKDSWRATFLELPDNRSTLQLARTISRN